MEDIRLGRSLATGVQVKNLPATTNILLAPADTRRTFIAFHSTSSNYATIKPQQIQGEAERGMSLTRAIPPLEFDIEDYGPLVCGEWWGYSEDGGVDVTVVTSTLMKE